MSYVDLHVHTEYTQGNALSKVADLAERSKALGMSALAITDSASVAGFIPFAHACKNHSIRPIFGCGFYIAPGTRFDQNDEKYHLVLLAKDDYGLANILRLMAESLEDSVSKCPRIDLKLLQEHSRGIICLTGGESGIVDKMMLSGKRAQARKILKKLTMIFDNQHLFLEIQNNGIEKKRSIQKEHKRYMDKFDLQCVVTGGSFYMVPQDAPACNRLRRKNKNTILVGNGYSFKSPEEIDELFNHLPKAIDCAGEIAERCHVSSNLTLFTHRSDDPRERLYELMEFCKVAR